MIQRDIFLAIADPTRRAILSLLLVQGMTPGALAEHFSSSRQAVSKHIGILVESGLVTQRPKGREIHYYLDNDKIKELDAWLEPFRKVWTDRFDQLDDLLNTIKD